MTSTICTGASAPTNLTLPLATDIVAGTPIANGDSFDFTVINTGTGATNDVVLLTNTGLTLVGNMTVGSLTDGTIISGSGLFRVRRVSSSAVTIYRLA